MKIMSKQIQQVVRAFPKHRVKWYLTPDQHNGGYFLIVSVKGISSNDGSIYIKQFEKWGVYQFSDSVDYLYKLE